MLLKLGLMLSVVELHMLLLQLIIFLSFIIMLLLLVMMRKFLLDMLPVLRTRTAHHDGSRADVVVRRLRCVVGRNRKRRGGARR